MGKSIKPIISRHKRGGTPAWVLCLLFAIPGIFGVVGTYFLFIRPIVQTLDAKKWIATPCMIDSSRVATHSGSKGGVTYSVEVIYHYDFGGQPHMGRRDSFTTGSSSSRSWREKEVALIRPGTHAICYVNPKDASDSVLNRDLSPDVWFGLLPMVFAFVGAGGIVIVVGSRIMPRPVAINPDLTVPSGRSINPGQGLLGDPALLTEKNWLPVPRAASEGTPLELKPTSSRLLVFLFLTLFAIFWNGGVSIFIVKAVAMYHHGHPDWFLNVFLIPLGIAGIAMILAAGCALLALLNPGPSLKANTDALRPGDQLDVSWTLGGSAGRVRRLHLWLEGHEEVSSGSGKSEQTIRNTFFKMSLVDTQDPAAIAEGIASAIIPTSAMHSLAAPNNKIFWILNIHGDIPYWPNIMAQFPIYVLPPALERS